MFSSFEYGFKYENVFNDSLNLSNLLNNFRNMKKKGFENITSNLVKELEHFMNFITTKICLNVSQYTDNININA